MRIIPLYRYKREGGGITVSPIKPDVEYEQRFRLIADEGKELTRDGVTVYSCVDVVSANGWYEITAHISEQEVVDA